MRPVQTGWGAVRWETEVYALVSLIAFVIRCWVLRENWLDFLGVRTSPTGTPLRRKLVTGHLQVSAFLAYDSLSMFGLGVLSIWLTVSPNQTLADWLGWYFYAFFIGSAVILSWLAVVALRIRVRTEPLPTVMPTSLSRVDTADLLAELHARGIDGG